MEIRKPSIQKSKLREAKIADGCLAVEVENSTLKEVSFENSHMDGLNLGGVFGESLLFSGAKIEDVSITDSILNKCDFSGTVFGNVFLERVEIDKSRIQGTQFMDARLKDAQIKNSKCIQSSFRFSKMKNVAFVDCDLSGADFQGAILENVMFQNCNLTNAVFISGKLKNVDVAASSIEGIKINKEAFIRIITNTSQALYFSPIFGIVIEE